MTWKMTLEELVAGSGGKLIAKHIREFSGVGTDTRADLKGKIFIALKGESFDAHDFLAQAVASGASALLVHRLPEKPLTGEVTIVQVDDTLTGLQRLGNFWRKKMNAKILGVTGTNGKTTTKEFAASLIGSKRKVHYSKGSLNNHWGVPMSLLAISSEHEIAVIEMGMNHPGELTMLSRIAEPDAVVVTMVGRGHLQGLGSVEGVKRAKSEIYAAAPQHATMIFNLENEHTRSMHERFSVGVPRERIVLFAGSETVQKLGPVDVSLAVTAMTPETMRVRGEIRGVSGEVEIPVFGRQNVTNLMTAACLALVSGLTPQEIWKALPLCHTVWGRNQWVKLKSGARVLFDGYNANPESMKAAIENFSQLQVPGRKFAILGEMKEMGEHAPELHRELGESVARVGFAGVSFFGPSKAEFEAGIKAGGFQNSLLVSDSYEQSLAPRLLPMLDGNDIVLIKGSRGMALEKVLADLQPVDFQAKK